MSPEYDKFTRFLILSYKIKKRKDQMYFLIFSYLIVIAGALAVYRRWPSFGQGNFARHSMLPT